MSFDRRSVIGAGLGFGAAISAARADEMRLASNSAEVRNGAASLSLVPENGRDQTAKLQAAIDIAAERNVPVVLPAGTFM